MPVESLSPRVQHARGYSTWMASGASPLSDGASVLNGLRQRLEDVVTLLADALLCLVSGHRRRTSPSASTDRPPPHPRSLSVSVPLSAQPMVVVFLARSIGGTLAALMKVAQPVGPLHDRPFDRPQALLASLLGQGRRYADAGGVLGPQFAAQVDSVRLRPRDLLGGGTWQPPVEHGTAGGVHRSTSPSPHNVQRSKVRGRRGSVSR